jgi:hypothetical protein
MVSVSNHEGGRTSSSAATIPRPANYLRSARALSPLRRTSANANARAGRAEDKAMSTTSLIGAFTNNISGVLRTLVIASEDPTTRTISGIWISTINGIIIPFQMTGTFSPGGSGGLSPTIYFSLSGAALAPDPNQQPAIARSVNAITGYAEPGATAKGVDRLYITVSWGEDRPGNAKDTGAWPPSYLDRS